MSEAGLTWTCHVCGRERPDECIAVHRRDVSLRVGLPPGHVRENVRYCLDRPECVEAVPLTSVFTGTAEHDWPYMRALLAMEARMARESRYAYTRLETAHRRAAIRLSWAFAAVAVLEIALCVLDPLLLHRPFPWTSMLLGVAFGFAAWAWRKASKVPALPSLLD